jgi:hypothetical protein
VTVAERKPNARGVSDAPEENLVAVQLSSHHRLDLFHLIIITNGGPTFTVLTGVIPMDRLAT